MAVAIDQEKLRRLRQKVAKLPLLPGVYLMRDAKGTIIYVGKAKLLKNRVGSWKARLASSTVCLTTRPDIYGPR